MTKSEYANFDDLNALYNKTVGRDIDKGGFDYWNKHLAQGTTDLTKIGSELVASKEYTDRAAAVASNPNITEAELDSLDSAYSGDYASKLDEFRAAASASVAKGGDVHAGNVPTYDDMFNEDGTPKPTWEGEDKWNLDKIKSLKSEIDTLKTGGGSGTTTTTNTTTGLTIDDINKWYETKIGGQSNKSDKFDDFKEFMGLIGGMGGMFGGGGVPGFASGGVAAASPYNNFMGFMNAFKSLGGGSQAEDITTGNIN